MNDARNDWKRELQPTPACIPIERLGEQLTSTEREHLATCPRCQTEMALFNEFENSETAAGEDADVQAIVETLQPKTNVVSIASRRRSQNRLLAIAAALVIALGIGYMVDNREPAIEGPVTRDLYRSSRVEVIAPTGDLTAAPADLQWKPASGADEYEVIVSEVDRTELWRATTHDTHIALPQNIVRQIVPGKTLVWEVTAKRAGSTIQSSGAERFRVTTQRSPN